VQSRAIRLRQILDPRVVQLPEGVGLQGFKQGRADDPGLGRQARVTLRESEGVLLLSREAIHADRAVVAEVHWYLW